MNIPSEQELARMAEERCHVTDEEWRKRIDSAIHYMKIVAGNESDNVIPQLVVHLVDSKGETSMRIYAMVVPFDTPEEKKDALYNIGVKLYPKRLIPVTAFLISDAWMATEAPAGDQPDRKECVIIAGFNMVPKRTMIATSLYRRDEKGIIHLLDEPQMHDGGHPHLLMEFYRGYFSVAVAAMRAEGGCP